MVVLEFTVKSLLLHPQRTLDLEYQDGGDHRDYLTIRLRARDFYAVIVDEGEARINYHRIEIESE